MCFTCPKFQQKEVFFVTAVLQRHKFDLNTQQVEVGKTHSAESLSVSAREHRIFFVQLNYNKRTAHYKMKLLPRFQSWSLVGNRIGAEEVAN